jgi:hypothetical protein
MPQRLSKPRASLYVQKPATYASALMPSGACPDARRRVVQ